MLCKEDHQKNGNIVKQEERHNGLDDPGAILAVKELDDNFDIVRLKDVFVVLPNELLQELKSNVIIYDPKSIDRLDLDCIRECSWIICLFHSLPKIHIIYVGTIVWCAHNYVFALGLFTRKSKHQSLFVQHLLGLRRDLIEVLLEVLDVNQVFENVFDQINCSIVNLTHVEKDQIDHLIVLSF